jgi:cellulose synthase/poly-beta-1,6-N-acetylglucosamine synthase-like glycosyltransferase
VEQGVVTDVRLPRNLLAKFQVLEYLRGFLVGRMGFSALGMTLIISGAFGLFRRETVVAAGGYASWRTSGETVGEDMELVVRLQRYCREHKLPGRVTFIPDPVAWTECPENLRLLGRQRDRWQRGLVESLMRHRVMLGNPRYGRIGLVAFPYYFFLEMLGPGLEFLGYVAFALTLLLGLGSPMYIGAFLAVAVLYGMAISVGAVVLEELTFRRYTRFRDLLTLFGVAVIENFGYRQLSTFFRFRGLVSAMRRVRSWGSMDRQGFERIAGEPSTPQKTQDPDRPNDKLR